MYISLPEIVNKYNLNLKGVIQVGAHWAEEHDIYVQLGIKNIVYIEPCKEAFLFLINKLNLRKGFLVREGEYDYMASMTADNTINTIVAFQCACGEQEGEFDMYVSKNNQGQSNSLLQPNLHLQQHPEVVFTDFERVKVIELDKLGFKKEDYNLLMMDVQGAEGLVLKGATETLKYMDCIYSEINKGQTYSGNMEINEMDSYLKSFGFIRVETYWPSPNWTWGDAVFIRETLL